jgi:DNA-binding PadR family transcriptional regulator
MGEVEQWVLLSVLRLGDEAFGLNVLQELDREAGHVVSRGSLYKTLGRLRAKGLVDWELEDGTPARGGHPRRRFRLTPAGLEALREGRARLLNLWSGLEAKLEADR